MAEHDISETQAAQPHVVVRQAMLAHPPRKVDFRYRDKTGRTTTRQAEPYNWKPDRFVAICSESGEFRTFLYDRMYECAVGDEFRPIHPLTIPL